MNDFIVFDMSSVGNEASESFESMKKLILDNKPKDVLFFCGWELLYPFINDYLVIKDNVKRDFEIIHDFGDFLEEQNVQFHLISTAFDDEVFDKFKHRPVKNFTIHFWKSWCLFGLTNFMKEHEIDLFEKNISNDFEKMFVCFMNKRKYHRQVLIDLICENNLFEDSVTTWNNGHSVFVDARNHEYKCWKESVLSFDSYSNEPFLDSSLKTKCLINLVTETHRDGLFFSEKTWKPIITGQPFISLGAKNQNLAMKELGFQTYDELFDYSFDSLENVEDRAAGVVKNLINLRGKDLNVLYDLVKEKTIFNKNRAKQILNESLYIPNIILDLFAKHNNRNELTYFNVMNFLFDHKKSKV